MTADATDAGKASSFNAEKTKNVMFSNNAKSQNDTKPFWKPKKNGGAIMYGVNVIKLLGTVNLSV